MTGAAIEIRPEGLAALDRRIDRLLAGLNNPEPLLRELAAAGESQTRRRMESDKRGPDGTPWPEWSPGYAATRHGGQSLLDARGDLIQSLTAFADRQTAGWGTNLIYAATHQFGRGAIPARPFLGVSDDDERELLDLAEEWLDRLLGGGAR
ncbi:MAG TPA: phage virion morphogenesis protein [Candidatus Competibacter sp.]|nr:phage virion morphogenesis protein [Candidatus Competibacter sp.]